MELFTTAVAGPARRASIECFEFATVGLVVLVFFRRDIMVIGAGVPGGVPPWECG